MREELERLEALALARARREDAAYTKQYFTIGRQAHVRSTQSFGAPALVWHVAFWPKRDIDPQDLHDPTPEPQRQNARASYDDRRKRLARDFDGLLDRLQTRGRVPGQSGKPSVERFNAPVTPADWETGTGKPQVPVGLFATESIAFTMWWGDDANRQVCPAAPPPEDLRVRVQADVHPDFATITFIIDAGKSWDLPPILMGDRPQASTSPPAGMPGTRRNRIFHAARTIREICEKRLDKDPAGTADILPEADVSREAAKALLDASNELYQRIWAEFCKQFGCSLAEIAGETDKIFANFRGVVLSTPGRAPESGDSSLSRFRARGIRDELDDPHPNAVVKAYWPFVRRTRSEADYRDWIACGVFSWRALYITALGGQSDFDPGDEARVGEVPESERPILEELGAETRVTSDVPEGYLPQRLVNRGESIEAMLARLDDIARGAGKDEELRRRLAKLKADLDIPETSKRDRPAPFRYLFLTSGDPHRRQVGRMVDRVNLLGTVRLYAMKNFSIIRDADVHVRVYGQLLDQIMRKATDETNRAQRKWWEDVYPKAQERLSVLWKQRSDLDRLKSEETKSRLHAAYDACVAAFQAEAAKLKEGNPALGQEVLLVTERPLMLYRRLLDGIVNATPSVEFRSSPIFKLGKDDLEEARKDKSERDEDLAQINRHTDLELVRVKTYIDELGRDAIGGLPFRINRSRYYADMYRALVKTLRVGTIDTWWDYEQLASRGVEPPFKFIDAVGRRLEGLRVRLRDAMEAVQTSAIANQTEATRDNTFQLEVIARAVQSVEVGLAEQKSDLLTLQRRSARLNLWVNFLYFLAVCALVMYGLYWDKCFKLGPLTFGSGCT
jgi:hypothetical protein